VDALSPDAQERVRIEVVDEVRRQGIRELRTDVVYAVARRTIERIP
jgi:hypothetical protein